MAPTVVAAMFGFLPTDQAVRLGMLLVLLTPCIDYVIVFSGLAGASSQPLLATAPDPDRAAAASSCRTEPFYQ